MKANEAPENIYVELCSDGVYAHVREWENSDNIEYTRADVFIEKACEWLGPVFKDLSGYYSGAELLEDFKNYMKGE